MSATTFTGSRTSSASLLHAVLIVVALAVITAAAYVIGRITTGDGTHAVRTITTSAYWPQVTCHVGRPC